MNWNSNRPCGKPIGRRHTRRGVCRGSATLELAAVLPMLLTLMLLCADFGRFAHWHIAVTNAARVGAGYACTQPVTSGTASIWQSNVRAAVIADLQANTWFDASKLGVSAVPSAAESNGLRHVTVEATYPFQTLINWPFLPGYNDPLTLRRTVVMRVIR